MVEDAARWTPGTWLRSRFRRARARCRASRCMGRNHQQPTVRRRRSCRTCARSNPGATAPAPQSCRHRCGHRAVGRCCPVACFDTSFHRGQPAVAEPEPPRGNRAVYSVTDSRFLRIHWSVLPRGAGDCGGTGDRGPPGSGASLCAMQARKASTRRWDSRHRWTESTRPGALDPGVVLYLPRGCADREGSRLLYKESGLLGISGISNDMRDLLASDSDSRCHRLFRIGPGKSALDGGARRARCAGVHGGMAKSRLRSAAEFARRPLVGIEPDARQRGAVRVSRSRQPFRRDHSTNEELAIARITPCWG